MVSYSIGDCINDRYKVENFLGTGKTSEVYKVYDKRSGRYLSLKLLKEDYVNNYAIIKRFKNEANILSKLSHHNIVRICDIYFNDSVAYYTMEYLEGMDLSAYIRNTKKPSINFVFEVLKQTLEGIAFLHSKKIIHRDIKPTNIFLINSNIDKGDKVGEATALVKLLDFGVIKTISEDETETNLSMVGTWLYMAPEQLRGKCTFASDIYSIGETMFELLSGSPRCLSNAFEGLRKIKNKVPSIVIDDFYLKGNSGALDASDKEKYEILSKWLNIALHPDEKKRFKNCQEALDFLSKKEIRKKVVLRKALLRGKSLFLAVITLIFIIILGFFIFHAYNKNKLYKIGFNSDAVSGLNRFNEKIWELKGFNYITSAELITELTPEISKAVVITTGEKVGNGKNNKVSSGQLL